MDRFFRIADLAQVPMTLAAYVGAALAAVHYLAKYQVSMPWQVAAIVGIIGLGFLTASIQLTSRMTARRELKTFALYPESTEKAAGLMERVHKSGETLDALNQATASNGKGLDKATLDRALDRLIETMDGVNRELDELLAKAKGE